MPVSYDTLNRELHELLRSRGYDPVSLDSKGDPTDDVEEADVFRFTVMDEDDNKINAWATVEGNDLVLYIDDTFVKHKDFEPFTQFLKRWSQRKLLGFDVSNKDRLLGDMKKRTIMNKKEQVLEGYFAMGKKASYSDNVPQVKIILQHTRQLEEGEQRFRNIAKIFVENTNGERFLLPTNRPGLARVYARHIAEGGTPYDDKGRHITSLCEEYTQMAGFVRATRNGQFNESALRLVNEGLNHYNSLRMTLQGMASHRGYNKYFESYTPVLNEETDDDVSLNELFVQETLDPRIESVMPILKRLSKNINEMSAVKELDEWAESILEVEDETTKTLAEPAEEMLDERNIENKKMKNRVASRVGASTDLYGKDAGVNKYDHQPSFTTATHSREVGRSVMKDPKISSSQVSKLLKKNSDPDMFSDIKEAPGAETLKHNQNTEKSNLKAFDLGEEEVEESGLQAYLGKKKYGEEGMEALQQAGREGASKEKMANIRAKYDKLDEEGMEEDQVLEIKNLAAKLAGKIQKNIEKNNQKKKDTEEKVKQHHSEKKVEEDLGPEQKAAGQLGPTEKVGPKGAVGKLVGASESKEFQDMKRLAGI